MDKIHYVQIKEKVNTVDSRYCNTAGIRKKYEYIQTIDISSTTFNCLLVTGILKRYLNKQYFDISDILITRGYCTIIFSPCNRTTAWSIVFNRIPLIPFSFSHKQQ